MTETTIQQTLEVPGAVLTYDIERNEASDEPVLLLFGCPMDAPAFGTLAGHFTDRTVVRYDPRGVGRSRRDDGATSGTPEEHADDLHRLIDALGAGPVDLFGTSGGAVNALALVARHPEQVRTAVVHEPPVAALLPDREFALAAVRNVQEAYERDGFGHGMAAFIALVGHTGPIGPDYLEQPAPDPAMFGLPAEDDGSRNDPLLAAHMTDCTGYEPDIEALRAASTRVVLGAGTESEGQLANRGAYAVAERLGTTPVSFPGNHGGFLGGEYGQPGVPEPFAARLREVLSQ
jgi:pimeloyl-ACP methyl ester carboxylesterase